MKIRRIIRVVYYERSEHTGTSEVAGLAWYCPIIGSNLSLEAPTAIYGNPLQLRHQLRVPKAQQTETHCARPLFIPDL